MTASPYRHLTLADRMIVAVDKVLKSALTASRGPYETTRPYPGAKFPETVTTTQVQQQVIRQVRINHAGEVAAQALYHGQALTARSETVTSAMQTAADEESDHLAWCAKRLDELGGRTSVLNPLWYAGSFAIGALAGLSGDRNSLGFVAETERQVIEHLEAQLRYIPTDDERTRAVIKQMAEDEARHGNSALAAGGSMPPGFIKQLMRFTARVMITTAKWV